MNRINRLLTLTATFLAILCIAGCGPSPSGRLDTARKLADTRPDSAYIILRDIDYNTLGPDSLKARYVLTKAMTNLRMGRSLITDTLLDDAASYYISAGDTANWVLASQMLAGHDLVKGDAAGALDRLAGMVPKVKNPELLWDTHMHLLEVSMNSERYADAYGYADWLLTHTDVPDQRLRFAAAKGAAQYMQGNHAAALAVFDSIIATGVVNAVRPEVSADFFCDYAEILDGAGRPRIALAVLDSLYNAGTWPDAGDKIQHLFPLAQFNANAGDISKAKALLDSIYPAASQSVIEAYAGIAMLKAAVDYKSSGRFPSELMHRITKAMHRNYMFARFNSQTAMESVIELGEDKAALRLRQQRLWMLVFGILLIAVVAGIVVYAILARRKRRIIEAEERIETLDRMIRDAARPGDSDKDAVLKRMVLRQMGILKTFAAAPTSQNEEVLRKISAIGASADSPGQQLVDWDNLYTLVDELFDGFHDRLVKRYPDFFTEKEIQLICLLRAEFSTKEISFLTGLSSASVYVRKSTIRKKLGTAENGDFMAQIAQEIRGLGTF